MPPVRRSGDSATEIQYRLYKQPGAIAHTLSALAVTVAEQRLEDKIRALSARAIAAVDSDELKPVIRELRAALKEHVQRLRKRAAEMPLPRDRRNSG
jgi:hypothetical protein